MGDRFEGSGGGILSILGRRQLLAGLVAPLIVPSPQGVQSLLQSISSLKSSGSDLKGTTESMRYKYTSDAAICARLSPTDFAVDGDIGKREWECAEWESFHQSADGSASYPDATTRVGILWTRNHLYLAFRSPYSRLNTYHDSDIKLERWELWERDVVEVFLNPHPAHVTRYYEFEVAPNNQWLDLDIDLSAVPPAHNASWNSGFEHATKIDTAQHLWTCEMRIPYLSMGVVAPSPQSIWRINLFRAEGFGNERRLLAWSVIPGSKTFHVPARFGRLCFKD